MEKRELSLTKFDALVNFGDADLSVLQVAGDGKAVLVPLSAHARCLARSAVFTEKPK